MRIEKRAKGLSVDRYDALDDSRRRAVREEYARLADEKLLVRIDAERSLDEVMNEVWTRIEEVRKLESPDDV